MEKKHRSSGIRKKIFWIFLPILSIYIIQANITHAGTAPMKAKSDCTGLATNPATTGSLSTDILRAEVTKSKTSDKGKRITDSNYFSGISTWFSSSYQQMQVQVNQWLFLEPHEDFHDWAVNGL